MIADQDSPGITFKDDPISKPLYSIIHYWTNIDVEFAWPIYGWIIY